ncbi:MAG TPA: hypothetical protein VMX36_14200, partial [Sedimentisphaerales bacterium]|nr:hypothetical protein [Sedimentisphaerales bacterium]
LAKIRMATDIIFQYPPLPHNLSSDGIEPLTTDAEDRLSVSESPVSSFLAHERMSTGCGILKAEGFGDGIL